MPSIGMLSMEEVLHHSTLTALLVERSQLGLQAALSKMPALQTAAMGHGSVGVVLVNKTPFIEFLNSEEIAKELGCGVIATIPPAGDLYAGSKSAVLPILAWPESAFAECIHDLARHLNPAIPRFLAA